MSPQPSRSPSPPETDIAAAMGFASFGAKPNPPKRKRKLAGTDMDMEGSGSNNTPLGVRRRGVDVEVEMGMGERRGLGMLVGDRGLEGYGDGGAATAALEQNDREIQKADTPLPNRQIDKPNLPSSTHQPPPTTPTPNPQSKDENQLLEEARKRGLQRLNQMAQQQQQQSSGGPKADGEWDWNALRRGVRDEKGDMAFYDKSFVEDPWRGL